jgi:hypothetical protein
LSILDCPFLIAHSVFSHLYSIRMHPDGPINIMDIREIIDRSALFALKRKPNGQSRRGNQEWTIQKFVCCISVIFFNYFFGDTLTYNNIPFGVVSCNLSFILIIQLYAKQLNIFTNRTTALGICSVLITANLVGSSLIGRLKKRSQT